MVSPPPGPYWFSTARPVPRPPAGAPAVIPSATVLEDGNFRVESHPLGYGAAPGKYAVLVRWPDDPTAASGSEPSKTTKIKGKTVVLAKSDKGIGEGRRPAQWRYMDLRKPLLQAEVKAGRTISERLNWK